MKQSEYLGNLKVVSVLTESGVKEVCQDSDFEAIYNKFNKKDYFGFKYDIERKTKELRKYHLRGKHLDIKEDETIKKMEYSFFCSVRRMFEFLRNDLRKKDKKALKSKLRSNQKFLWACFEMLTERKFKTVKDIHTFIDNLENN